MYLCINWQRYYTVTAIAYTYTHVYICVYVYMYTHTCMYVYLYIYMRVFTCVRENTYMYVYMHIYMAGVQHGRYHCAGWYLCLPWIMKTIQRWKRWTTKRIKLWAGLDNYPGSDVYCLWILVRTKLKSNTANASLLKRKKKIKHIRDDLCKPSQRCGILTCTNKENCKWENRHWFAGVLSLISGYDSEEVW